MIKDYKLWKEEICHMDDILNEVYKDIQEVMKKTRDVSRAAEPLGKPLHKANTSNTNAQKGSLSNTAPADKPPPLTVNEKALLMRYCGCFKCRKLDQKHWSCDCPNNFPLCTGYHELSMSDVPAGCKPEPDRKTVAAVMCARSESPQCGRRTSSSYPNTHKYSELPSSSERPHLVATVLGSSRNRVKYSMPANQTSVLDRSNGSGLSSDVSNVVVAVISDVPSVTAPSGRHLWWKSVAVSKGDIDSVLVHTMSDSGSHLDLVSPAFID